MAAGPTLPFLDVSTGKSILSSISITVQACAKDMYKIESLLKLVYNLFFRSNPPGSPVRVQRASLYDDEVEDDWNQVTLLTVVTHKSSHFTRINHFEPHCSTWSPSNQVTYSHLIHALVKILNNFESHWWKKLSKQVTTRHVVKMKLFWVTLNIFNTYKSLY